MEEIPVTSWPVFLLYLVVLIVAVAILRHLGRGWLGAVPIALVIAGVLSMLSALLVSKRRRP